MKKIIPLLMLILASCSNPKDTVIPPNVSSLDENSTFVQSVKKLSPEDKELLGQYIMMNTVKEAFGGEKTPIGITVKEALEIQKKYNANAKLEEQKAEQIRQTELAIEKEKLAKIKNSLEIYFINLTPVQKVNYSDYFGMRLKIKNTSGKVISGFKASVTFSDQFNNHIQTLTIEDNDDWAINHEGIYAYNFKYNQFEEELTKLLTISQDKLKTETIVTDVVFKGE